MAPGVRDALLAEAARAHPQECCGLLLGESVDAITAILPAANIAASPEREFEIDPATLITAHRAARNGGPAVLGYYHSHPAGTTAPSAQDRACAARDGRIWAIVAGNRVGWWRDGIGGFAELSTGPA